MITGTPIFCAFVNLDPEDSPETTKSVFLPTELLYFPPRDSTIFCASLRVKILREPVNTNIFPELFPSTVLLEGLILKKPVMNISLYDRSYNFEFEKSVFCRLDLDLFLCLYSVTKTKLWKTEALCATSKGVWMVRTVKRTFLQLLLFFV